MYLIVNEQISRNENHSAGGLNIILSCDILKILYEFYTVDFTTNI